MNSTTEDVRDDLEATREALSSLMFRLRAASIIGDDQEKPFCPHLDAISVRSIVTGEALAALCPDCDEQLPVYWANPSASTHDGEVGP